MNIHILFSFSYLSVYMKLVVTLRHLVSFTISYRIGVSFQI